MEEGARWESHAEARVKFLVPVDWTTTRIDNKTIKIASPDDVFVEFRYFNLGAPEAILDEKLITAELQNLATDLKITNPPAKFEQHGLAGFGVGGTGHREDKPIAWFSITIGDKHGHGVLTFGFGEVTQFKTQYKTIVEIMSSIQPIG